MVPKSFLGAVADDPHLRIIGLGSIMISCVAAFGTFAAKFSTAAATELAQLGSAGLTTAWSISLGAGIVLLAGREVARTIVNRDPHSTRSTSLSRVRTSPVEHQTHDLIPSRPQARTQTAERGSQQQGKASTVPACRTAPTGQAEISR